MVKCKPIIMVFVVAEGTFQVNPGKEIVRGMNEVIEGGPVSMQGDNKNKILYVLHHSKAIYNLCVK